MKMPSSTYDKLSWVSALIPIVITFVGTVLTAFDIGESIVNMVLIVIGACGTLLNGILKISSAEYYKQLQVDTPTPYYKNNNPSDKEGID